MGVDVKLYAENVNKVDQEYLDRINAELTDKYINPRDKTDVWEIFEFEGPTHNRIVFKTMQRYYGIGYERGDWVRLSGLINILRQISGGKVYYYGDNQDEPNYEFTRADQDKLDKYWADYQDHPYRDFFK
jgi:hypothetical protein